jgi:hypothetical protein
MHVFIAMAINGGIPADRKHANKHRSLHPSRNGSMHIQECN